MANIVDRKWNSGREIDDEDPLMQLSRIMSESSTQEADKASNAMIEADLESYFDFDDDFSTALDDAFLESRDARDHDVPVELSLEDELAALLSDAPVSSDARLSAVSPPYQQLLNDERIERQTLPVTHGVVSQIHADTEIVDDQFEADPWLDIDLDEEVKMVSAAPMSGGANHEEFDTVLSHMSYGRSNARYVVEKLPVLPVGASQNDDIAVEDFEFDLDTELAPIVTTVVSPNNSIEFAHSGLVPSVPKLEMWQPEAAPSSTEPEADFDFSEDFDRLLAETAPEPVVEAIAVPGDHVTATEDFNIPDFEFSDDPIVTESTAHDTDEDYRAYQAPSVKASIAPSMPQYAPQLQSHTPDLDSNFESVLNDELSADLDVTIGSYQADEIPAIGSSPPYRTSAPFDPRPADDFEPFSEQGGEFANAVYRDEPVKSRSRLVAAILAGALVLGSVTYYAYSKTGSSVAASGGPVLVKADPQPVKVAPEAPGGKVVADQDKAVYDKVAGAGYASANPGQLVTASEEPVDIAAVASDPVDEGDNVNAADVPASAKNTTPAQVPVPQESPVIASTVPATASKSKAEDRVDPALDPENAPAVSADATAVTPKKVRTFVVKPDGTLVERAVAPARADPLAATVETSAAELTPETKNDAQISGVAKITQLAEPSVKLVNPVASDPADVPKTQDGAAMLEAMAPNEVKEAPVIKVVKTKKIKAPKPETETLNADAATGAAPIIDARPADQPVTIVGKTGGKKAAADTQIAAADTTPQATANQTPAATGAYVIQIASTPSPEAAQATYAALSRKFSGVIGGRGVNIQQAEVAGKGTVYRVRINAGSKQDATALCSQYKSSGGSCFVSR